MSKQRGNDVDPLSEVLTEDVTIRGILMHVHSLSYRELAAVTRPCKGDADAVAAALVLACVTRADGKDLSADMRTDVFNALSEVVARVNGFPGGNSSATGADDSSTA